MTFLQYCGHSAAGRENLMDHFLHLLPLRTLGYILLSPRQPLLPVVPVSGKMAQPWHKHPAKLIVAGNAFEEVLGCQNPSLAEAPSLGGAA